MQHYRQALNGYNGPATFRGTPILHPWWGSTDQPTLWNGVDLAVEQNGGFTDRGWCRFSDYWVVNAHGMESATFKRAAQIGTSRQNHKEEAWLSDLVPGPKLCPAWQVSLHGRCAHAQKPAMATALVCLRRQACPHDLGVSIFQFLHVALRDQDW